MDFSNINITEKTVNLVSTEAEHGGVKKKYFCLVFYLVLTQGAAIVVLLTQAWEFQPDFQSRNYVIFSPINKPCHDNTGENS